jgi:hypothetical protein
MIEPVVETWHRFAAGERPEALEDLLADDVVFYSPIVYTPQRGKDVTTMYLRAPPRQCPATLSTARFTIRSRSSPATSPCSSSRRPSAANTSTGVDIIRCDDTGGIVEFRVMIRPLRAVNAVHEQMRAMLVSMQL